MSDTGDPLLGTVVAGRYRVLRALGRGGMGAVYVAEQAPLGREVALKVLRPDLADNDVAIERFKREAQLIGALGHPHVVGVHDFGTADGGALFIAMELLRGEDLAARLRRAGPLDWQRALHVVEQIARALAGAHAAGVIHRDLKPANVILMNGDGAHDFVKVVDFGIAKLMKEARGPGAAPSLTGGGFVPGTVGYIAPENISGTGGGDDPRSDVYSLGVTWFEMLTGRCAFTGDSAMQIVLKQLNEDPPRPTEVASIELPARIEALLMRMLHRDPSKRPPSANALLAEIAEERRLASHPLDADASQLATATSTRTFNAEPRRRSRAPLVAAGVAFVALIAGAASTLVAAAREDDDARTIVAASDVYYPSAPRVIDDVAPAEPPPIAAPLAAPVEAPVEANVVKPRNRVPTSAAANATSPPVTSTSTAVPTPVPAVPVANAPPNAWRDDALTVLSSCDESCARVISGRLKTLDVSTLTARVRAGVDECVAKCRRPK